MLIGCIALGIFMAFGMMQFVHATSNMTTLESFQVAEAHKTGLPYPSNCYDLGVKNNLLQIFGRNKLLWLLPIYSTEGDGFTYERAELIYE